MHTTDLSARALVKADVPLSSEERLRELAAILAAGVLRLRARPESTSADGPSAQAGTTESGTSGREDAAEKLSESPRNCLDVSATPGTHVPAV